MPLGGYPAEIWVIALGAYLIGGFPTGVVLSRFRYGIDVREMGSGNIGATNITRVFGWGAGVLTLLIDVLKGYLPLMALERWYPSNPWVQSVAAAFLVLGHCFSPYLKLRGGKGVATGLGCLLAVDPLLAGIAGAVYGLLLAVARISAVGSLGAMIASLGYVFFLVESVPERYLVYGICFVVFIRHRSNLARLWRTFQHHRGKK